MELLNGGWVTKLSQTPSGIGTGNLPIQIAWNTLTH